MTTVITPILQIGKLRQILSELLQARVSVQPGFEIADTQFCVRADIPLTLLILKERVLSKAANRSCWTGAWFCSVLVIGICVS